MTSQMNSPTDIKTRKADAVFDKDSKVFNLFHWIPENEQMSFS